MYMCLILLCDVCTGANILTRSLIQFGQGMTRSHPHLLHIIKSIQAGDDMRGFNASLTNIITHGLRNTFRSLSSAVTRTRMRGDNPVAYYESQLARLSADFALCSDFAMVLGGKLKLAEFTSGRYADILSNLFLGYAVLWHYSKYPAQGVDDVVDHAMQSVLNDIETAFFDIFANFPMKGVGPLMQALTFPTGRCYAKPRDNLTQAVAVAITTDSSYHQQLLENIYVSPDVAHDRVALILSTLPKAVKADAILTHARKNKRALTPEEKTLVDEVEKCREEIIQVDSFARLGQELNLPEAWNANQRPAYTAPVYKSTQAATTEEAGVQKTKQGKQASASSSATGKLSNATAHFHTSATTTTKEQ